MTAKTVGTLYARVGQTREAMEILREAMREAETAHGRTSRQWAEAALELGRLHVMGGDPVPAQELLSLVADVHEGLGRHRDLAEALLMLAFACEGQENFSRAEAEARRALTALETCPPEDPLLGQVILNLGRFCVSRQKASEAERLFEEALRIFSREDPLKSSNSAVARNGLGLVYNEQGRYSEAIALFEKALSSFEAVHGPDFPDVATVLRNMAFAWRKLGDERKARELLQRAARIGKA